VRLYGVLEDLVEVGGFEGSGAGFLYLLSQLEDFGDVFAGGGAGQDDRGEGDEVEVGFELVHDAVGGFGLIDEIAFGEDEDDAFSGCDDLAGDGLVEFGVGGGAVDEEAADVGLFDGGEGAQDGEFFDADFPFAGFSEAGGVEDLKGSIFELDLGAVDVAGGALLAVDEGLLFGGEGVEEAGFADVGATDES